MFFNCNAVLQNLTPANERIDITKKIGAEKIEMYPVGIREEIVRTIIYSKDVLANDIPASAEKIIWGPLFQPIIDEYKVEITNKINNAKTQITKDVYKYVLDNLEQAPIELRSLKNNSKIKNKKVAEKGRERLEIVFNSLLEEIRKKQNAIESERRELVTQEMEKLQRVMNIRNIIGESARLSRLSLGDTDKDIEIDLIPKKKRKLFNR